MSADRSSRVHAIYEVETSFPLEDAIAVMAGEQSSGTFLAVPGETPELKQKYGARIEWIREIDTRAAPSLPGARTPKGVAQPVWRRAQTELSWPIDNLGASVPNLLATVAGNLFELQQFSALRLLDITLPDCFRAAYPGPQFGVGGTRRLSGVETGPLIGTIVKPSVGLSPEQTASLVDELAAGGIDFVKDDELRRRAPADPGRALALMVAAFGFGQILGPALAGIAYDVTGSFFTSSIAAACALVAAAFLVSPSK